MRRVVYRVPAVRNARVDTKNHRLDLRSTGSLHRKVRAGA